MQYEPWDLHMRLSDYFDTLLKDAAYEIRCKNPGIKTRIVSTRVLDPDTRQNQRDLIIHFERDIDDLEMSNLVDDLFNMGGLAGRREGYVYLKIVSEDFIESASGDYADYADYASTGKRFKHNVRINLSLIEKPIEPNINLHKLFSFNLIPIGNIYAGVLFNESVLIESTYNQTLIESKDWIKTNLVYKTYIKILNTALGVFKDDKEILNKLEITNSRDERDYIRFNGHKGCGGY